MLGKGKRGGEAVSVPALTQLIAGELNGHREILQIGLGGPRGGSPKEAAEAGAAVAPAIARSHIGKKSSAGKP
jgi:hypothetical protein